MQVSQSGRWFGLAAFFVVVTVFVACAKNDKPQTGSDYSFNWEPSVGGDTFTASYNFKDGTCETAHTFVGSSDFHTRDLKCTALRDNELNESCAETDRLLRYAEDCQYATNSKASIPLSKLVKVDAKSWVKTVEPQVWAATQNLWILDAKVIASAKSWITLPWLKVNLNNIAADLINCGSLTAGPRCLSYSESAGHILGVEAQSNESGLAAVEVSVSSALDRVLIVYTFNLKGQSAVISAMSVYKQLKPYSSGPLKTYIADSKSVELLATAVVAEDTLKEINKVLAKPANFQQLYHAAEMLLHIETQNKGEVKKRIAAAFAANAAIIGKSDLSEYQEKILGYFKERIDMPQDVILKLSEQLLATKTPGVQQVAAVNLLEANPARTDIRSLVRDAAVNTKLSSDHRKRAINALAKNASTEDKLIFVRATGDIDLYVRQAAKAALGDQKVQGKEQLEVVDKMLSSSDWEVRRSAAELLSRSDDVLAIDKLVSMLVDRDSDVRRDAVRALERKNLTEAQVPGLLAAVQSSNWEARANAAKLLARIPGDKATLALIDTLDDRDSDVRREASRALDTRPLGEPHVASLKIKLESGRQYETRQIAARLMGKTHSKEALKILLDSLPNERDSDVRREMANSISALRK